VNTQVISSIFFLNRIVEVDDSILSGNRISSTGVVYLSFPVSFHLNAVVEIRTYTFALVMYGCETWLLTLREERRLKLFENRALRRVFGPKRGEVTGNGENYIMRSSVICTLYPVSYG
jgi:hypothetical protein